MAPHLPPTPRTPRYPRGLRYSMVHDPWDDVESPPDPAPKRDIGPLDRPKIPRLSFGRPSPAVDHAKSPLSDEMPVAGGDGALDSSTTVESDCAADSDSDTAVEHDTEDVDKQDGIDEKDKEEDGGGEAVEGSDDVEDGPRGRNNGSVTMESVDAYDADDQAIHRLEDSEESSDASSESELRVCFNSWRTRVEYEEIPFSLSPDRGSHVDDFENDEKDEYEEHLHC
ncbi:hypothetical protein GGG16DRAFT_106121 [Schizophyllum commune]